MTASKFAIVSLVMLLFGSACSRTAQRDQSSSAGADKPKSAIREGGKPEFTIAATDLAGPAVLGTNSTTSGDHATVVLRLQLAGASVAAFQEFTRAHKSQQTQLVIGSRVVAEPYVVAEIADGRVELAFSSLDEAREIGELLVKK